MEDNISSIFDLITILGTLPNHKLIFLKYGIALLSDFYFGNFVFLPDKIPCDDYNNVYKTLSDFYSNQKYQIYCTTENSDFLNWLSQISNKSISYEPAMAYDLNNYIPSEPKYYIELATRSDAKDLAKFMTKDRPDLNRDRIEIYLEHLLDNKKISFYYAKHDGIIVGSRMIHHVTPNKIQGNCNLVDKNYRRYGIATALLTKALNDAKEKDVKLFVNQTTPDGYNFCTRFGCQQVGTYIYI